MRKVGCTTLWDSTGVWEKEVLERYNHNKDSKNKEGGSKEKGLGRRHHWCEPISWPLLLHEYWSKDALLHLCSLHAYKQNYVWIDILTFAQPAAEAKSLCEDLLTLPHTSRIVIGGYGSMKFSSNTSPFMNALFAVKNYCCNPSSTLSWFARYPSATLAIWEPGIVKPMYNGHPSGLNKFNWPLKFDSFCLCICMTIQCLMYWSWPWLLYHLHKRFRMYWPIKPMLCTEVMHQKKQFRHWG